MNTFKAGYWLACISDNRVCKCMKATDKRVLVKYLNKKEVWASYKSFRRASVHDYLTSIHIVPLSDILNRIGKKKCCFCPNQRKDTGDCNFHAYSDDECKYGIRRWLGSCLTDEKVEQLGGKDYEMY